MINLVIDKNLNDKRKIIYTFYYLVENLSDDINVSYEPINNVINIYYGVSVQTSSGISIPVFKETDYGKFNFHKFEENSYASFEEECDVPFIEKDNVITFNYDVFSISKFLFSCEEEYMSSKKDSMGRFLADFSVKKEVMKTPLFDINSFILYKALLKLNPMLTLNRTGFEIYLTHDIDNADSRNIYIFLHNLKDLFFNKNKSFPKKIKKLLLEALTNRYNNILKYIELEKSYGAKSEFYFIQGKKHRYGSRYKLSKVKSELDVLGNSKDFVIGLHTNYFSYDDKDKIIEEKEIIEKYANVKIRSCRNHYLRFKVPETWEKLKDSGIFFDTTLGFPDSNGFRASTSKAFLPFNLLKNEVINIYEIPLAIMDVSVMEKQKTLDEKWNEIKNILDQIKNNYGTSSIVWHEDVYNDDEYRYIYEKILDYIKINQGRFINHYDLINRFKRQKSDLHKLFNCVE